MTATKHLSLLPPSTHHSCPLPPAPQKNGSYIVRGLPDCLFRPLSSSLFEKTSHQVPFWKNQQMRDIQKKSVDFTRQRSAAGRNAVKKEEKVILDN